MDDTAICSKDQNILNHAYALIMAGGRGTRFWPLSRRSRPKQLLAVAGPLPLVQATLERIRPLVPAEKTVIGLGEEHALEVMTLLEDLPRENFLVEPAGRNTAPGIGLAAHWMLRRDPQAVMVVLPADHHVARPEVFRRLVAAGIKVAAETGTLLTLGIRPDRPETGYGYLETGPSSLAVDGVAFHPALRFHEKPNRAQAEIYLADPSFLWNSGVFIWTAKAILDSLERWLPEISAPLASLAAHLDCAGFSQAMAEVFPRLPAISIDYGVMEKAEKVLVIPADIGWNDLGSWPAAAGYWPEREGNAVVGRVVAEDSRGCLVYSPERLVALIGVEDLMVIDTPDALLVGRKDRDQDLRLVVARLEADGLDEFL